MYGFVISSSFLSEGGWPLTPQCVNSSQIEVPRINYGFLFEFIGSCKVPSILRVPLSLVVRLAAVQFRCKALIWNF